MKDLIVATKNPGKAEEFKKFFKRYNINAYSLLDLPKSVEDIEETGTTFQENAALKAEQIVKAMGRPVIADDSGLLVDALEGEPGVFSARYAGEPKNDQANIDKVLKKLKDVPNHKRTARFICVLALARPSMDTIFCTGYCEGQIAFNQVGSYGFGYDPIFVPEGFSKSMAELHPDTKNEISHRSHAMKQLETWIEEIR